jgi:hypothetical protein
MQELLAVYVVKAQQDATRADYPYPQGYEAKRWRRALGLLAAGLAIVAAVGAGGFIGQA